MVGDLLSSQKDIPTSSSSSAERTSHNKSSSKRSSNGGGKFGRDSLLEKLDKEEEEDDEEEVNHPRIHKKARFGGRSGGIIGERSGGASSAGRSLSASFSAIAADVSSIMDISDISDIGSSNNSMIRSRLSSNKPRLSSSNPLLSPIISASTISKPVQIVEIDELDELPLSSSSSSVNKNLNLSSFDQIATVAAPASVLPVPPQANPATVPSGDNNNAGNARRRSRHQNTVDSLLSLG